MKTYRSSIRRIVPALLKRPALPAAGAILTRPVQSPGSLRPRPINPRVMGR